MTTPSRKGERLGDYELLEVLEFAATHDLYLATDHRAQRRVEISVLNAQGLSQPGVVERLVRAANLALESRHPALARVLALDADAQGIPFVVAEHVGGRSLRESLVDCSGGQPLIWALHTLTPVVEAVAVCHRAGLCHGGIDLDHVVVGGVEAGHAKLRRRGLHRGLPAAELAPELRAAARAPDERSDVWALAAVLRAVLLGAGWSQEQKDGWADTPAAARLPVELVNVLSRCLASAPEARPMDARALRDTLLCLRERVQKAPQLRPPTASPTPSHGTDVSRSSVIFDPVGPAAATRRTLVEFATPRRARRRRRSPLTDPALRSRDSRQRMRRTVIGNAAQDGTAEDCERVADAAAVVAKGPAQDPSPLSPESQRVGEREPSSYAMPSGRFLDLPSKRADAGVLPDAAEGAQHARAAARASSEPCVAAVVSSGRPPAPLDGASRAQGRRHAPKPREAHDSAVAGAKPGKPRPMGGKQERLARSLRVKARGDATRARARVKLSTAVPARDLDGQPAAHDDPASGARGAVAAEAAREAALHPALRTGEARPRFGQGTASVTTAIASAGEHDARAQLRVELFSLGLCMLVFFGVPILCDPTHTRAHELFGSAVKLGLAGIAASAIVAALQLWWLQATTRRAALWPAATALKLLALLVCFLSATYLAPSRMLATLEQGARAILPWTAGVFYLALGLYGVSRHRYNAAQHAAFGIALSVIYGSSVVGSFRVVDASLTAQRVTATDTGADPSRSTLASARSLTQAPRPSTQLGAANHNLEAELERLGDTSGEASGARSDDGSDELRSTDSLHRSRSARTQQLDTLDKQIKATHRP